MNNPLVYAFIDSHLASTRPTTKYMAVRLAYKQGYWVDEIVAKSGWSVELVRDAIFGRPINLTGEARTDE